jgi:hypothetical protein
MPLPVAPVAAFKTGMVIGKAASTIGGLFRTKIGTFGRIEYNAGDIFTGRIRTKLGVGDDVSSTNTFAQRASGSQYANVSEPTPEQQKKNMITWIVGGAIVVAVFFFASRRK